MRVGDNFWDPLPQATMCYLLGWVWHALAEETPVTTKQDRDLIGSFLSRWRAGGGSEGGKMNLASGRHLLKVTGKWDTSDVRGT